MVVREVFAGETTRKREVRMKLKMRSMWEGEYGSRDESLQGASENPLPTVLTFSHVARPSPRAYDR